MKHLLRQLPAVHELQKAPQFLHTLSDTGFQSTELTKTIKDLLTEIREELNEGKWEGPIPGTTVFSEYIFSEARSRLGKRASYTLTRVINATGTILHTNLGRARLSRRALEHVAEIAENYSNLEYNLQEGSRGSRHLHAEKLIKEITGAQAAMIVNNNAAAVYLILKALAFGKEVIVSRGQLVEIGGSFRISSIMEESGAKLIEVGTTNKTHLFDYENAINEDTSMLLKVHTSNFRITGFTKTVESDALASLAAKHDNILFYEDLGSGVLYDFKSKNIGEEPIVSEVLKQGADIVSFSGDKLFGGPQAGIIAGRKEIIDKLKKHQLARVLRVDKMTLAALEGTLADYVKGKEGVAQIPVVRDLLKEPHELKETGNVFIRRLQERSSSYSATLREDFSQVGGGTMPDVELPAYSVALSHVSLTAEELARKLRLENNPPIIVRIKKEELLFDFRTVDEREEEEIIQALTRLG
ncbi:L-seryl-tRNA(Sec) selenium transferase [Bacillus massilinigeriensis]|uniref:L-seryl-tRNA(Sec) selenium transferase n=1 Tax=Bacillus mediterraneensis TaxID=1805474 RepID=UPI0008F924D7|nr:L-seryl-tRNA(Sec) selenium transferase [Bacillus mediterraneensis]